MMNGEGTVVAERSAKINCYSGGEGAFMEWGQAVRGRFLLPVLRLMAKAGVRANHPEIPKPNKNRARTWYWAGGDAANLDETIALVKSMGIDSRGRVRHYVLISI